jgi:hypothetical protein
MWPGTRREWVSAVSIVFQAYVDEHIKRAKGHRLIYSPIKHIAAKDERRDFKTGGAEPPGSGL